MGDAQVATGEARDGVQEQGVVEGGLRAVGGLDPGGSDARLGLLQVTGGHVGGDALVVEVGYQGVEDALAREHGCVGDL